MEQSSGPTGVVLLFRLPRTQTHSQIQDLRGTLPLANCSSAAKTREVSRRRCLVLRFLFFSLLSVSLFALWTLPLLFSALFPPVSSSLGPCLGIRLFGFGSLSNVGRPTPFYPQLARSQNNRPRSFPTQSTESVCLA